MNEGSMVKLRQKGECLYCGGRGLLVKRHVPDARNGRWIEVTLIECQTCQPTAPNGDAISERVLTVEEARALGLRDLAPEREVVG